jgi:hypothetical protein
VNAFSIDTFIDRESKIFQVRWSYYKGPGDPAVSYYDNLLAEIRL